MPRTKLDKFSNNPETYRMIVNRVITSAMGMAGIKSRRELGEKLGYSESQVSDKFGRGKHGWTLWDIRRMNDFLYFTEPQRNLLFGGPPPKE